MNAVNMYHSKRIGNDYVVAILYNIYFEINLAFSLRVETIIAYTRCVSSDILLMQLYTFQVNALYIYSTN